MQQIADDAAVAAGGTTQGHRRRRGLRKRHAYFLAFAVVFACFVLAGFMRTYFIPVSRGTFVKPLIVHIHGVCFLAWTGLLISQAMLAATGRLRAHRTIGSVAGWLVLPMLALGAIVAARATVHDFEAGKDEATLSFFYGELADLAMFGLLAGGAMLLRNRPEFHKRWVLLGSLGLLGAAVGRIPFVDAFFLPIFLGLVDGRLRPLQPPEHSPGHGFRGRGASSPRPFRRLDRQLRSLARRRSQYAGRVGAKTRPYHPNNHDHGRPVRSEY